jgi:ribonuclease HI
MRRWVETLCVELGSETEVATSTAWRSPWNVIGGAMAVEATAAAGGEAAAAGAAPTRATPAGGTATVTGAAEAAAGIRETPAGVVQTAAGAGEATLPAEKPRRLRVRVDGGSRGNPGPGAIGVVLEDPDGAVLEEVSRVIGVCTNNVAEYRALLAGLDVAKKAGAQELEVLADSELLVKQLRGEYKVKNEGLKPLYDEAVARLGQFRRVSVRHVRRAENVEADRLVNEALDEAASAGL